MGNLHFYHTYSLNRHLKARKDCDIDTETGILKKKNHTWGYKKLPLFDILVPSLEIALDIISTPYFNRQNYILLSNMVAQSV